MDRPNKQFYFFAGILLVIFALAGCATGPAHNSHSGPSPLVPNLSKRDIDELPSRRRIVVGRTLQSIGTAYAWGGTSPATGFDCSGLVMYTHAAAGIATPRTARAMYSGARSITGAIRPGDLVFFDSPSKGSGVHVGIFVGRNSFVHAPGKGKKVRQASLGNPYFSRHFIGAKTFL